MERFATKEMKKWKESSNRKPLVITGARQVGKTWLMKEFGRKYYKNTAYISFCNNPDMKNLFDSGYNIKQILPYLSIEAKCSIEPGSTLIIFDEIQNAPKAFEALKHFCEDAPQYHIVAADSLPGAALHESVSYPAGKVEVLNLYPLNFREFLYAVNEKPLADALLTKDYAMIDIFADKYIYHLKNYYYTGGMPEVVENFRLKSDYKAARKIQKSIIARYRVDLGKHAGANELKRINMVWESIPVQLAKENKKFFFGKIKQGGRSSEFETAIQRLVESGLARKVNRVNEPRVPLAAYKDFSSYKLFASDIGLLCAMGGLEARTIIEGNSLFTDFYGALTEQYVMQQLISDTKYEPYYFGTEKATFKQDFLIQKETDVIPIEVKAETNVRSQSLKAFYDKFKPAHSVRFSLLPYREQEWMTNIPLYAVCNL